MLQENPALQPKYDMLCKQQEQIDALKAGGAKKIPAKLIIDPYRLAYEKAQGMVE